MAAAIDELACPTHCLPPGDKGHSSVCCGLGGAIELSSALAIARPDLHRERSRLVVKVAVILGACRNVAELFFVVRRRVHGVAPWLLFGAIRVSAVVVVADACRAGTDLVLVRLLLKPILTCTAGKGESQFHAILFEYKNMNEQTKNG